MRRPLALVALLLLLLLLPLAGWAQDEERTPPDVAAVGDASPSFGEGLASWYGLAFQGRRTASGERFDMNALTAAHPSLPFGTRVLVRNPRNDRQVVVRINDRGPHVPGRVIDLSHAAARALGLLGLGPKAVVLSDAGAEPAAPEPGRRR